MSSSHVRKPINQTLTELQSLRGLAASAVLVHHSLRSVHPTDTLSLVADRLVDAQAVVVFFFVLSGYVLSASLSRRELNLTEIASFYIRRLFRIYPAILVACLAIVIVLVAVPHPSGKLASLWIRSYHTDGLAPRGALVLSFLAVSTYLHPMLWTMFVELNASAFMPAIRAAQLRGARGLVVLVVALSLLSVLFPNHTKLVSVYLVTFAIGATVPFLAAAVGRLHRRSRVLEAMSLVAAVMVMLWFRELIPREHMPSHGPLLIQVEALAGAWIIALTVHRPNGYPGLRHPVLVKLGDVSYGIYLLHFPVLLVLVPAAEKLLSPDVNRTALGFGIAAVVYVVTVAVSALCYVAVELPAVAIGRRLAQLVRDRVGIRSPGAIRR